MRILSVIITFFLSLASFAQSFDKGNRNFDVKLDFAAYSGTVQDNQMPDSIVSSGAASIILTPQMEWGTGKRISIGTSLAYSHYLDSSGSTGNKPRLNGLDANFNFNFHFLRKPKTDVMVGFKLGIAGIRLNPNDGTGDVYGSMGSAWGLNFTGRFFVSDKVGIIANLAFPNYWFSKFGKNLDQTYAIRFKGVSFGAGVAIKLAAKSGSDTKVIQD